MLKIYNYFVDIVKYSNRKNVLLLIDYFKLGKN